MAEWLEESKVEARYYTSNSSKCLEFPQEVVDMQKEKDKEHELISLVYFEH